MKPFTNIEEEFGLTPWAEHKTRFWTQDGVIGFAGICREITLNIELIMIDTHTEYRPEVFRPGDIGLYESSITTFGNIIFAHCRQPFSGGSQIQAYCINFVYTSF